MLYITNPPQNLADGTTQLILYKRKLEFTEALYFVQDHTAGELLSLPIVRKRGQIFQNQDSTLFFGIGLPSHRYISTHVTKKLKIQTLVCITGQLTCLPQACGTEMPSYCFPALQAALLHCHPSARVR